MRRTYGPEEPNVWRDIWGGVGVSRAVEGMCVGGGGESSSELTIVSVNQRLNSL